MASAAILDFQKLYILTVAVRCRGPMCAIVPNFIKIVRTVGNIWCFNIFSKYGGRPPSWICWARIGTTHDDYSVVSTVCKIWLKSMQYFRQYETFHILLIQARKIGVFFEGGKQYQQNPQNAQLHESASFEPSSVKIRRRV